MFSSAVGAHPPLALNPSLRRGFSRVANDLMRLQNAILVRIADKPVVPFPALEVVGLIQPLDSAARYAHQRERIAFEPQGTYPEVKLLNTVPGVGPVPTAQSVEVFRSTSVHGRHISAIVHIVE